MNIFSRMTATLRKSALVSDSVTVISYKALTASLGVATSICLAKSLSLGAMGEYFLWLSYFAIAELAGLPGSFPIIVKGAMKGADAVYRIFLVRSLLASFGAGLVIAGAGVVLPVFFVGFPRDHLFLLGVYTCLSGLNAYEYYLVGKKKFSLSQRLIVCRSFLTLIGVTIAAYCTQSAFAALCAYVGAFALTVAVGTFCVLRLCKGAGMSRDEFVPWWEQGKRQIGQTVVNICSGQAAKVLLGNISPELLALYQIGVYIPTRVKDNLRVVTAVVNVHWSSLTLEEHICLLNRNSLKILVFSATFAAALLVAASVLIPVFYGEAYRASIVVAQLFCISLFFNICTTFIKNIDIYQKESKLYVKANMIEKALFLALLAWCIPVLSYIGPVVASLIVEIISFVIFGRFFLHMGKEAGSSLGKH